MLFNITFMYPIFRLFLTIIQQYNVFNVHGSMHRNNILIFIQQDATLHSLFYLETTLHISGDDGWWYHPKHVEQFPHKIKCVALHLVGYILENKVFLFYSEYLFNP